MDGEPPSLPPTFFLPFPSDISSLRRWREEEEEEKEAPLRKQDYRSLSFFLLSLSLCLSVFLRPSATLETKAKIGLLVWKQMQSFLSQDCIKRLMEV